MPVTLAFRFPLGRYHANPWNRAVNEGASEWPPSPWRILRALVATWHTRWPELAASELDALLGALADPPCYRTPPAGTGHTRHYLPDLDHRKAETGHTDLTLDPFLTVSRESELLVRWNAELTSGQRETLAKLAELIPYLGRSESVCEARLLDPDGDAKPDETWWRPVTETADGSDRCVTRTRLLAPSVPFDREVLEATTGGVRRAKRTVPPGTEWITYVTRASSAGQRRAQVTRRPHRDVQLPTAVRFSVVGRAPLQLTSGVLLADEAHRVAGRLLEKAAIPDGRRRQIMGTMGAETDHAHVHWIPLGDPGEPSQAVRYLVVYVRDGLEPGEIGALIGIGRLSGKRGGEDGYKLAGFPEQHLLFQAAGQLEDVARELCTQPQAGRRCWRSVTPYLPVRHPHPGRQTEQQFLAADVTAELGYRNMPAPEAVTACEPLAGRATQFRRYRSKEKLRRSRPGTGLRIEFAEPVEGPLLLGQLSHFGFGIFRPEQ